MSAETCQSDFFTTTEAAQFLGVSIGTLEVWRCTKRYSLPYLKIGRLVKYRRHDLVAWAESRRVSCAPVGV